MPGCLVAGKSREKIHGSRNICGLTIFSTRFQRGGLVLQIPLQRNNTLRIFLKWKIDGFEIFPVARLSRASRSWLLPAPRRDKNARHAQFNGMEYIRFALFLSFYHVYANQDADMIYSRRVKKRTTEKVSLNGTINICRCSKTASKVAGTGGSHRKREIY